jgi:hypothetical protein
LTCPTATVGSIGYPTATTWQATVSNMQPGSNIITASAVSSQGKASGPVSTTIQVSLPETGGAKIHSGIINPASDKSAPDIGDALAVLRYIAGLNALNDTQLISADVAPLGTSGAPQGNGTVDIADVVMILRRCIGVGNW